MSQRVYLLDANVFIQAARQYYSFDLAPGFWQAIVTWAQEGRLYSIDRVLTELSRGNDELSEWADTHRQLFVRTDEGPVIKAYRDVMVWLQSHPQYRDTARAEFAKGADGWLVACARARGLVLVTQESPKPDARSRVPIPNVCQAFGVSFVDTFTMLREIGFQFR